MARLLYKTSLVKKKKPTKSNKIPATQEMLFELRDELKSDIGRLDNKIDAVESRLDQKIDAVEARLNQKIDRVLAEVHRLALLVEEQNARNKYVLDGYSQLYERQHKLEQRQDRQEKRLDELESSGKK